MIEMTSSTLSLLFVIKGSALNRGMNTGIENLAWRLAARGVDVHVLAGGVEPQVHGYNVPENVTYHFTGGTGDAGDHVTAYRALARSRRFDAVIGWIRTIVPLATLPHDAATRPRFIANQGNISVRDRRPTLRRLRDVAGAVIRQSGSVSRHWRGVRHGAQRLTAVAAISCAVRDNVLDVYRIAPARVSVIPRGVDTEFFRPRSDKNYATVCRPPRLLFTGNILEGKGLGDVASALEGVQTPLEWVLAGNDRGFLASLQARVAASVAGHRVTWTGPLPPEGVLSQLQRADFFVFPSRSEGLGKSLLEAMACALPVIVSDFGPLPEVVNYGESGLIVPVGDVQALTMGIESLLADSYLRAFCGRNARLRIKAKFGSDREVVQWLDLLASHIPIATAGRTSMVSIP